MRGTYTRGEDSLQIYWRDNRVTDSITGDRVVAGLGFFDGVHLGHQAILKKVQAVAAAIHGVPVAVTFDRHPLAVIDPSAAPLLLTSREERRQYMWDYGMEGIAELTFDGRMANLEPEQFARDILSGQLSVVAVVAGADFTFGYRGRGGVDLLRQSGAHWGIKLVETIDAVRIGDEKVSSTRIRALLQTGSVEDAAQLLGRPYRLAGPVVEGEGRGRRLGFPTANLAVDANRLIPIDGVYAVTVRELINDRPARYTTKQGESLGVLSISNKPTFAGTDRVVEVHVLDQQESYYGKRLEISFHSQLRPIRRFANAKELQEQIAEDIKIARKLTRRDCSGRGEKIYSLRAL